MPNNPETTVTPARAADLVAVEVYTIRRWCDWHKEHLSPGASPAPGALRKLTQRDLEVLRVVRELRAQGLTTHTINEQLGNMAFPEINTEATETTEIATPDALEEHTATPALAVYIDAIQTLQRRVDGLEEKSKATQQNPRDFVVGIAIGALGMAILFLLLVGLGVLYGGFR